MSFHRPSEDSERRRRQLRAELCDKPDWDDVSELADLTARHQLVAVLDALQRRIDEWAEPVEKHGIDLGQGPGRGDMLRDVAVHVRDIIRDVGGVNQDRP